MCVLGGGGGEGAMEGNEKTGEWRQTDRQTDREKVQSEETEMDRKIEMGEGGETERMGSDRVCVRVCLFM